MNSQPTSAPQNEPSLCAGGCGFFGSPDTSGFCSVCWRAHQSSLAAASHKAEQGSTAAAAASPAASVVQLPKPEPAVDSAAAAEVAAAASPAAPPAAEPAAPAVAEPAAAAGDDKPVQENRSRCFTCRKKVGLLGFECRCGYVFCSGHRHAQDHACMFDYASFDKANLAKANNKVVAAKVDKL